MTGLASKVRTAWALGLSNIARATVYRVGVKLGVHPVRRLHAVRPQGPFFRPPQGMVAIAAPATPEWGSSALLFGRWPIDLTHEPPDWLANPISGRRVAAPERDWWTIPDFDPVVGDIKPIWELSRLDWALAFAQRARQGHHESLDRLNAWLEDWCVHNPPYQGPNWKCGQEASIRVMHLAMAALMLGQTREAAPGLIDLVRLHLRRIAPTVQYAMAQDNNHGTSEAAALFIGGSWLAAAGQPEGERWAIAGRRWLENRSARLIGEQGSFSQYSLNYHRVMLDTLCMAEVWRRHLGLPAFSARWQSRALAATQWLRHLVNGTDGDGPNVGANDGARLLPLTGTPYRDHRPSVQTAMALFAGQRAYRPEGPWDHALAWLGIASPGAQAPQPGSLWADDGGFAVLRRGAAMALLRYPRFRFRPSQADALHLDLWLGADNLLRDAGTYSYHTDPRWLGYFGGTASHNTVQFDDRDQMPRLGRFLLGDWLDSETPAPPDDTGAAVRFAAGYRDSQGARHHREVCLKEDGLRVDDAVRGFVRKAVLRWRLMPGAWRLEQASGGTCVVRHPDRPFWLRVSATAPVVRCELVQGWESRHYLDKTPIQVLEVEIHEAGTLTTELHWTA